MRNTYSIVYCNYIVAKHERSELSFKTNTSLKPFLSEGHLPTNSTYNVMLKTVSHVLREILCWKRTLK